MNLVFWSSSILRSKKTGHGAHCYEVRKLANIPPQLSHQSYGGTKLLRGVGSALEEEFTSCEGRASKMLNKAAEQLIAVHMLSLDAKKSSGAPTAFLPTEKQRILEIDSDRRHLTIRQLEVEFQEFTVNTSSRNFSGG